MAQAQYESLLKLIEPEVRALGYDLLEIELALTRRGGVLRLYIDRLEGDGSGVGLDDCETVSHAVAGLLDVTDSIRHAYRLEVSSPGSDRPLRRRRDFERVQGQRIRLRFDGLWEGHARLMGRLLSVGEEGVEIESEGILLRVPWPSIGKARLVPNY
jgi:ribosome maturation factor RimP